MLEDGKDKHGNVWRHERCKSPRCNGRRNMFGYDVPDEIWDSVVPDDLKANSLCLTCFDEYAQEKCIKYKDVLSVNTIPITWEVTESYEDGGPFGLETGEVVEDDFLPDQSVLKSYDMCELCGNKIPKESDKGVNILEAGLVIPIVMIIGSVCVLVWLMLKMASLL